MDIKKLYAGEIAEALAALSQMDKGSKEYGDLSDDIVKMTDRLNEMERIDNDISSKEETREFEKEKLEAETLAAEKAREDERKDRFIKNCLTAANIGSTVLLFIWGAKTSWRWERTDTLTNTPGKEIFKAIFRLKK